MERGGLEGLGSGFGPLGRTQSADRPQQPPGMCRAAGGRDSAIEVPNKEQRGLLDSLGGLGDSSGDPDTGDAEAGLAFTPSYNLQPLSVSWG